MDQQQCWPFPDATAGSVVEVNHRPGYPRGAGRSGIVLAGSILLCCRKRLAEPIETMVYAEREGYLPMNADLRRRTDEVLSRLCQLRDSL
jgi:hypothetical protein